MSSENKPVPIKRAEKLPIPAVQAALGMATSYYLYPVLFSIPPGQYLLLLLMFLLTAALCLFRVLRFPLKSVNNGDTNGSSGKIPHRIAKIAILTAAAAVGFFLGIAARRAVPGPAVTGIQPERISSVSGILREDPRTLQGGSGLGILDLRECGGAGGLRATASGSLTVFFPAESIPRLREFGRGSEIYTEGTFVNSADGRGALFRANSVHIVKPAPAPEQFRTGLRMTLIESFQNRRGITGGESPAHDAKAPIREAPVWAGLSSALLLGVRDDLDVTLSAGFRNSGCSHILALSGMHLAIISGILAFLLRKPLGVRWASLAGAVFIVCYVFFTGSQPSLVRAAIMYLIGTAAVWGLLNTKPLPLLCMAFIIQNLFQSESGVSVSFILSYLALFGILTLGESIRSLFRGRLPEIINGGISASLGAFIVTAPVVVFYFNSLRPIGIIAGLFLAPLSSLFMILSLAALVLGFLPLPLWNILDFLLGWLYRFIELLVSLAGRLPGLTFTSPVPVLIFTVVFWTAVLFLQNRDYRYRNSIAAFN